MSAYMMNRGVSGGCKRVEKMAVVLLDTVGLVRDALNNGTAIPHDKLRANEELLNTWEIEIEDDFIGVVATQRPVATDLRFLAASLKIIDHLERIGDYLIHVMEVLAKIKGGLVPEIQGLYADMVDNLYVMLEKTIRAYSKRDDAIAKEAAAIDSFIDKAYRSALNEMYNSLGSPMTRAELGRHLMLLKYIERSADHVTDIDEWIVYAIESTHVQLNK
jgi:phosphate transport system protein